MNGIDIASYQAGIDLSKLNCDFVIVKSTEGTGYVNPDFTRAVEQGIASGKRMGIYHYASGTDPIKEAKFFLHNVTPYLGKVILCLDWERAYNISFGTNDVQWCARFMNYIYDTIGIRMFLYISAGIRDKFVDLFDKYPLWAAQYEADYMPIYDFQNHPWNEGEYECEIRQYTSSLYLKDVWDGRLDGNKAYISGETWDRFAAFSKEESTEDVIERVPIDEVAQQVLNGKWGNGETRKRLLEEAGYNYMDVQTRVNQLLSDEEITNLARRVMQGEFGNGTERQEKLGSRYELVQKRVNQLFYDL